MTGQQLRRKYLEFFARRVHQIIPSASLVPANDPTTLFTSSGMQPLVPYLLGQPHPQGQRLVDSQKSFRSQDIEAVGDNRHTTFFEMLGNWSLGDYFKKEQLAWVWQFLTDEKEGLGLEPQKLYVSVFSGDPEMGVARDNEAIELWQELFATAGIKAEYVELESEQRGCEQGMGQGRIFGYGVAKNWWSRSGVPAQMPAGEPGGPDSEVFYDFGTPHDPQYGPCCHPNCDCGRFLEIGNSVFMQYQKQADGTLKELPAKNVDFGGGLERLLAAVSGDPDVFTTDLFLSLLQKLEQLSGHKYQDSAYTPSFRVMADHLKAAVMLAADGVQPGSKEQGYFARRLLRRAIRHGKKLSLNRPFIAELVPAVAKIYEQSYPTVAAQADEIVKIFQIEEKKFLKTLDQGLREFERLIKSQTLTAKQAFFLYETYGFPLELSVEEAEGRQLKVDKNMATKFQEEKEQHAASSRTASAGKFKGGLADHSANVVKYHTATHLLHAALRRLLGESVRQMGSNITGERLRFDFAHHQALTAEQKTAVAELINDWIKADLAVTREVLPLETALQAGAMAFFGEKYPDQVSVYTIGGTGQSEWVSKELCGGPHVSSTGVIGPIRILKEKSAAAGVRRLYLQLA